MPRWSDGPEELAHIVRISKETNEILGKHCGVVLIDGGVVTGWIVGVAQGTNGDHPFPAPVNSAWGSLAVQTAPEQTTAIDYLDIERISPRPL